MRTIEDIKALHKVPHMVPLPAPPYSPEDNTGNYGLAVSSMKDHMTDEGWQIMQGLEHNGYGLCGHGLPDHEVNAKYILQRKPRTLVIQDKREWDVADSFRDRQARFKNIPALGFDNTVFKLTILKDSHQRPHYHAHSASEMKVHGWIIYYHPEIVAHLAPYVRPEHLIRTYHTLDSTKVPTVTTKLNKALLSGAVSGAYPLRTRLFRDLSKAREIDILRHPGYHRRGTQTYQFMSLLSQYKVSICTSSTYGYALRKIIESVACGCVVVTDLPKEEVLPEIDEYLVRVDHSSSSPEILDCVREQIDHYDAEKQRAAAEAAKWFYDFRSVTKMLAEDIEHLRSEWNK